MRSLYAAYRHGLRDAQSYIPISRLPEGTLEGIVNSFLCSWAITLLFSQGNRATAFNAGCWAAVGKITEAALRIFVIISAEQRRQQRAPKVLGPFISLASRTAKYQPYCYFAGCLGALYLGIKRKSPAFYGTALTAAQLLMNTAQHRSLRCPIFTIVI